MKAILTIGLPASGKSTWAREVSKENENLFIVERDELRYKVYANFPVYKPSRKAEQIVTELQRKHIESLAKLSKDLIISDTNLNSTFRISLEEFLKDLGYEIEYQYFTDVPYKEILKRDKAREHSVGKDVIDRMIIQNSNLFPYALEELSHVCIPYESSEDKKKCIIVDIDGTIAEMVDRSPYEFDKVDQDSTIEQTIELIDRFCYYERNVLKNDIDVILMSGRSIECAPKTIEWLDKHNIQFDELHMRAADDHRKDNIVKYELFKKLVAPFYEPIMVFDDRQQTVDMWKSLFRNTSNIKIFQVQHPGLSADF